jgi:methyltransferase (TIGR00027 family)
MPQVVILGAGFDCRIYRLSGMHSVTAFEVDHPTTVATKRSRLRTLIERLPPNVHFVQLDSSRQSLAEVFQLASFDSGRPTVFIWGGVTNLTADAVDAVLRYVASCAEVARLGEPWTFGLIPEQLPSYVGDRETPAGPRR